MDRCFVENAYVENCTARMIFNGNSTKNNDGTGDSGPLSVDDYHFYIFRPFLFAIWDLKHDSEEIFEISQFLTVLCLVFGQALISCRASAIRKP